MKIQKQPRGWSAEKKWRGFVYPIHGHFDQDYKISPICEIFHKSAYSLLIFDDMLDLALITGLLLGSSQLPNLASGWLGCLLCKQTLLICYSFRAILFSRLYDPNDTFEPLLQHLLKQIQQILLTQTGPYQGLKLLSLYWTIKRRWAKNMLPLHILCSG